MEPCRGRHSASRSRVVSGICLHEITTTGDGRRCGWLGADRGSEHCERRASMASVAAARLGVWCPRRRRRSPGRDLRDPHMVGRGRSTQLHALQGRSVWTLRSTPRPACRATVAGDDGFASRPPSPRTSGYSAGEAVPRAGDSTMMQWESLSSGQCIPGRERPGGIRKDRANRRWTLVVEKPGEHSPAMV